MRKTNEQGRSMIEMLGVLAIIGVLSVGGIAGFSKAMERHRINKTIWQISYISGNIRTLFGSQKDYDGIYPAHVRQASGETDEMYRKRRVEYVKKLHIFPEEMFGNKRYDDDIGLYNPFGGFVAAEQFSQLGYSSMRDLWQSGKTVKYDAFYITYRGIPREACIALMTTDWSQEGLIAVESSSGYHGYRGCKGTTDMACPGGSVTPVPMSVEKAVRACYRENDNTIKWMFY